MDFFFVRDDQESSYEGRRISIANGTHETTSHPHTRSSETGEKSGSRKAINATDSHVAETSQPKSSSSSSTKEQQEKPEGKPEASGVPSPEEHPVGEPTGLDSSGIIGLIPPRHNTFYYMWYSLALLLGSLAVPVGLLIMAFVRGHLASNDAVFVTASSTAPASTTDYVPNVPSDCLKPTAVREPDLSNLAPATSVMAPAPTDVPFMCAYQAEKLLPTATATADYGYLLPRHLQAEFCPYILYEYLVPRHSSYSTLQPKLEAKSGLSEILRLKAMGSPWKDVKIILSVGGHPEDQAHFASLVKVRGRMRQFAISLFAACLQYKASGVNIDWQHVKDPKCQPDQNDTTLLQILDNLRTVSNFNNRHLTLSVAVDTQLAKTAASIDLQLLESRVDFLIIHTHRQRPSNGPCFVDSGARDAAVQGIAQRMADSSKLCASFSMFLGGIEDPSVPDVPTPELRYSRMRGLATAYDLCKWQRVKPPLPPSVRCDNFEASQGTSGPYLFGWDGPMVVEDFTKLMKRTCVVYRDIVASDFLNQCTTDTPLSAVFLAFNDSYTH